MIIYSWTFKTTKALKNYKMTPFLHVCFFPVWMQSNFKYIHFGHELHSNWEFYNTHLNHPLCVYQKIRIRCEHCEFSNSKKWRLYSLQRLIHKQLNLKCMHVSGRLRLKIFEVNRGDLFLIENVFCYLKR